VTSVTRNKLDYNTTLEFVAFCVDDALAIRHIVVGWQTGFETVFVAVWSYLDVGIDDDEAEDLTKDLLNEMKWFGGEPTDADYILRRN